MGTVKKVAIDSPEFEVLYKECFKSNRPLLNAHQKVKGITIYVEHGITYVEFKLIEPKRKTSIPDNISRL